MWMVLRGFNWVHMHFREVSSVCHLSLSGSTVTCVMCLLQGSKKPPTPEPTTKPKPFKFELDKRPGLRSSTVTARDNLPMAEFLVKFQNTTPPRFRRTPASGKKPPAPAATESNYSSGSHVTLPKTPNLMTRTRKRPTVHKSTTELEEEEAKKMKQYVGLEETCYYVCNSVVCFLNFEHSHHIRTYFTISTP